MATTVAMTATPRRWLAPFAVGVQEYVARAGAKGGRGGRGDETGGPRKETISCAIRGWVMVEAGREDRMRAGKVNAGDRMREGAKGCPSHVMNGKEGEGVMPRWTEGVGVGTEGVRRAGSGCRGRRGQREGKGGGNRGCRGEGRVRAKKWKGGGGQEGDGEERDRRRRCLARFGRVSRAKAFHPWRFVQPGNSPRTPLINDSCTWG